MQTQRERFLEYGIPYDDIDPEMIELIDVLNFDYGLKTKFCCYGHDEHTASYVVFDECVEDSQIYNFINLLMDKNWGHFGSFKKWVRPDTKGKQLFINWFFESNMRFKLEDFDFKKAVLDKFVEVIENKL